MQQLKGWNASDLFKLKARKQKASNILSTINSNWKPERFSLVNCCAATILGRGGRFVSEYEKINKIKAWKLPSTECNRVQNQTTPFIQVNTLHVRQLPMYSRNPKHFQIWVTYRGCRSNCEMLVLGESMRRAYSCLSTYITSFVHCRLFQGTQTTSQLSLLMQTLDLSGVWIQIRITGLLMSITDLHGHKETPGQ